jgi:hypothetical protein
MCNENCYAIKQFITNFPDPLYALIPDSFGEYFRSVATDARTCYRRAKAGGLRVREVEQVTPELYQDIMGIWASRKKMQGRSINYTYQMPDGKGFNLKNGWPHPDYRLYSCPLHYFDFWGCFDKKRLVAYLELLHSRDLATVYSTVGHSDYLGKGVMKFLFMEVVRKSKIKYLHYGDYYKDDPRMHFMKDLRIINHNPQILRTISTA